MQFSKTPATETKNTTMVWGLALSAILIPMLSWSTSMLDETRFDGGLFSILCLLPIIYSLAHKRFALFPGSIYIFTAISLGIVAFFTDPRFQFSHESAYQGLADRAPILSTLILMCCLYAWPKPRLTQLITPICWFTSAACVFALIQALGWDPPGYENILGRRPAYPFTGLNHAGEIVIPILLLSLASLNDNKFKILRLEYVGSQVGSELREKGEWAVLVALLSILIYIGFRFEFLYGIGAIFALLHDVILTLGFFSITQLQFDLSVLSAILAVVIVPSLGVPISIVVPKTIMKSTTSVDNGAESKTIFEPEIVNAFPEPGA